MAKSKLEVASVALLAVAVCTLAAACSAEDDSVQRGREIASTHCARCHSIERSGDSPLQAAPPFRVLHRRYPVEYLEESLAEGMVTGHADMPEFRLEPDQIADFIDYLKSLEE